ncbi:pyridoxal phosphate-dependent aminotransferase [Isachenkonia alkalipeptolytica]|uniref:Aminotransferase n=1 Tax=Isachenkonia alkalipeptolytica TaxID=2565777 RepID=A0AA44BDH1_9CLOT|nr:threonine-phosphate decarboxylase [Isachenkonia alkalipeptolytica]NBG87105.1 aminotransferase class I/II-fold pyridoxal phosphate-dependent enzyme [Isachenkonia alkalipeptolytica]
MNKHGGYLGNKEQVIDFSVNISPFGPPESVKQGIMESLEAIEKYPSIDGEDYRYLLQKAFSLDKLDPRQLIIGNGAMELIYLFARSLKPKRVLLVQPTFNEYQRAFELAGTKVEYFILEESSGFSIPEDQLMKKLENLKPEALLLCSPNNPTGVYYEKKLLQRIAHVMSTWEGILFVDESFEEFVLDEDLYGNEESTLFSAEDSSGDNTGSETAPLYNTGIMNMFILRSLTKFYGIPGLRLGYGIGHSSLIEKLLEHKEPWTVNTFAFKALEKIVFEKEYPRHLTEWLKEEKNYLEKHFQELRNLGLIIYPSSVNFYLGKIPGISAKLLQEKLLEAGIYIRTCEDFHGLDHEHFRFALRMRKDNEKLIQALEKLLTD